MTAPATRSILITINDKSIKHIVFHSEIVLSACLKILSEVLVKDYHLHPKLRFVPTKSQPFPSVAFHASCYSLEHSRKIYQNLKNNCDKWKKSDKKNGWHDWKFRLPGKVNEFTSVNIIMPCVPSVNVQSPFLPRVYHIGERYYVKGMASRVVCPRDLRLQKTVLANYTTNLL